MTSDRWERIKELFEEVLERTPSERATFLDRACAHDEHLHAEVTRLIFQYESAAEFLESPPFRVDQPRQEDRVSGTALAPGTRLGPYEILALAGSGGMGEVYRARDTRLGRQVAIKVIGAALDGYPDIQRRFDDEVRLAASLDHPGICAVYDVGDHDGIRYFVMEYLEGESLATRLAKRPLPTRELLDYAVQIASALAYAHRHQILHRDVKPGNVFLTRSGVKVVDFGLAKIRWLQSEPPSGNRTLNKQAFPLTRASFLYGTPEYTAPERLEGREADHRSDIFAFGVLLYEMATGHRPFRAPTPAALLATMISSEPPAIGAHGTATRELDWVIRRCLKKNPDDRWESMGDIEVILKWLAAGFDVDPTDLRTPDGKAVHPSRAVIAAWTIAIVLLCVVVGAMAKLWLSPSPDALAAVVRFTLPVEPAPTTDFEVNLGVRLAISRDGQRLAYVSQRGGTTAISLRHMSSASTISVEGTDGATTVFFSPDGEQLGFFAAGKLKKVNSRGGAVLTICDVPEGAGATWGDDNTIIFAPSTMSALVRVSAAGGTPETITRLENGELSHRWPEFLPGATAIVYAASSENEFGSPRIIVQSLQTNSRKELIGGTYPRYSSSGHLVFARDGSLFALPFDAIGLREHGAPEPIVSDLLMKTETGAALFAVSNKALIYRAAGAMSVPRSMVWVGMNGSEELIPVEPRAFLQPRISPDGTRVAVSVGERARDRDLWIYDFVHRAMTRLTVDAGEDETAVWSPEGARVAFSAARPGQPRMVLTLPYDGRVRPTRLFSGRYTIHVSDWSPDGRSLAWTEFNPNSGGEIRSLALDGSGTIRPLTNGPFDARGAVFSADGRWIAYTSNESGRDEVYVQPYPGPGSKWQISTGGGQEPVWSRNGKSIYFRSQGRMMSVNIQTSPSFIVSVPRTLFRDTYEAQHRGDRNYDVSADGRRFLMIKNTRPFPPAELTVELNWAATLGRRE